MGQREYAIKHALTREVAYDSLPKARRARLHAQFAGWIERTGGGDDDHAPLLAHHYAEAVRPEDVDLAWPSQEDEVGRLRRMAVDWSRRAAALAVGRYEIDEGVMLLRRAVELESNPARQAELWYEIGHGSALKYDGEAFTAAMEKAIELGGPSAAVYAELGFQTVQRAGMWIRKPARDLVDGWIDLAVELAPEASRLRAKALVSRALWNDDEDVAREAYELAEEIGDLELRSFALSALTSGRKAVADHEGARTLTEERIGLLPGISDPDHRHNIWWRACDVFLGAGRLADARRAVTLLERTCEGLTPHHRIHAIGDRVDLESKAGRWQEIRKIAARVEQAVEANLATPCPINVACLLECAVASEHGGDEAGSRRLEETAVGIGMQGYGLYIHPPQLRLALARNDLAELARLIDILDPEELELSAFDNRSALFDALIALGYRERIEADAPEWLRPGTYVEPFAMRALGVAREDESLIERAAHHFEAMGLEWHAGETRKLLTQR